MNLTLIVNPIYEETENASICEGDSYSFGTQTLTAAGTFSEAFQSITGCDSIVTLNLGVTTINTGIDEDNGTLSVAENDAVYQWINCTNGNIPIAEATNQSFEPSNNNEYAVKVIKGGCEATSECVKISLVLGITENEISENLRVFPNPTNGSITIDFGSTKFIGSYQLVNLSGKVVSEGKFKNRESVNLEINGAKGVYLLKLNDENGKKAIVRLVKH